MFYSKKKVLYLAGFIWQYVNIDLSNVLIILPPDFLKSAVYWAEPHTPVEFFYI